MLSLQFTHWINIYTLFIKMNLQRFALTCSAGVLAFSSAAAESGNPNVHLEEALRDLKSKEGEIRSQWEKDEDGFRKLPARAWPAYQPDAEKMESLQGELVSRWWIL